MNNRLKKGLLAPLVLTIVTIGLFGISTVPMVNDVFAEQDKEVKNSNTNKSPSATITPLTIQDKPDKVKPQCSPGDPRCCEILGIC